MVFSIQQKFSENITGSMIMALLTMKVNVVLTECINSSEVIHRSYFNFNSVN